MSLLCEEICLLFIHFFEIFIRDIGSLANHRLMRCNTHKQGGRREGTTVKNTDQWGRRTQKDGG